MGLFALFYTEGKEEGNANLSKCAQPSQDAATDPRRVLALGRGEDLNAHVLNRERLHLAQQPVAEAFRQRATA
ncbi:hypothetical protein NPX13_g9972 [Xylaria arbuscula]|uniref:Uncharacterized protein n=1 Tax=Xylaria arbuscula TaxID=114810 RepID=A0A9W8N5E3_9PEZI|nr:hypothetical protein NPX13_g9972 [Xylaria arbuscula]